MAPGRTYGPRHSKRARPKQDTSLSSSIGPDLLASLVVFLVAVPLCIGIGAASGVPVELAIISGIVGGLVVGFMPGSTMQVSGPAAGLATLVLEAVGAHGVAVLGPVVFAAGVIQIVLGILRMGRLFQAISLAVVQGMLAGIGLPLVLSQSYALVDAKQLGSALKNIAGLPHLLSSTLANPHAVVALLLGVSTVCLCALWKKLPAPVSKVPAPLVAVVLGSVIAALPGVEVKKVVIGDLLGAVHFTPLSSLLELADPELITLAVTFAVIASAETLFSAAAVDRMHDGQRTQYNAELFAQGVGNTLCGFLGALPMTAVIARSSVNVQAGAKTKVSRVMHGVWLLAFSLLFTKLLALIPTSVLAGILLHSGWKLFSPGQFPQMWKRDRGEGVVMVISTLAIVATNLLEGVLAGLAAAIILAALRMSRLHIHTSYKGSAGGDTAHVVIEGNATFLRLPKLNETLDSIAGRKLIHVDMQGVSHLDLAFRSQVEDWAEQQRRAGSEQVVLLLPPAEVSDPDPDPDPPEPDPMDDTNPDVWFAEYPQVPGGRDESRLESHAGRSRF